MPSAILDERDIFSYNCKLCGNVRITEQAHIIAPNKLGDDGYILSSVLRERYEYDQPPILITTSNISDLITQATVPKTISQKLERILRFLENKSKYIGQPVPLQGENTFPIFYAKNDKEFRALLGHLQDQNLIALYTDRVNVALTPEGWIKLDSLRVVRPQSNQAFVAMWFTSETNSAYSEGIKKAIIECGFSPVRVDLIHHNDRIDDRIIAEIRKSAFLIADFTGLRGGVYFEAGFALGLGIPVIWCCRKDFVDQVHFDTRQYNHIIWENPNELYTQLKDRIEATIIKK